MNRKYLYYTLFTISLIIALYSYTSISKVYEKSSALDTYTSKINSLKAENAQLQKDLEYKQTDEFVINEARLKLNYGFKNERTYIIPKSKEDVNSTKPKPVEENLNGTKELESITDLASNSGLPVYKLWVRTFF